MKFYSSVALVLLFCSGLVVASNLPPVQDPANQEQELREFELARQAEQDTLAEQKVLEQLELSRRTAEALKKEHELEYEVHLRKIAQQRESFYAQRAEQFVTKGRQQSERQLKKTLQLYRKAKTEYNRKQLKDKLRDAITDTYLKNLDAYDEKITQLSKKLSEMENKLESHREAMNEMVELRLQLLTKSAELGELPNAGLFDEPSEMVDPAEVVEPPSLFDNPPESPVPPEVANEPFDLSFEKDPPTEPKDEGDSKETSSKIIFASEQQLEDGEITIIEITNKKQRTTISFDGKQDGIEVSLRPGKYAYVYRQDGKVWGKGKFVKKNLRQVIEIETGECTAHMLEKHKVPVTFKAAAAKGINLFVQGVDNNYRSDEFTGDFDGELEFKYLPGKYLFVFSNKSYKSIQTFDVTPGKPMTLDLDKNKKKKE